MEEYPITVVGIGNAYRSDDGIGLYVARQIESLALSGVKVVEGIGDGFALIDAWADSDHAFVIDCASSGAPPGTTYHFDPLCESIPSNLFSGLSTHSISVNEVIDLARVLNRLPRGLIVYGIEGKSFSAGIDLTPEVRQGANKIIERIVVDIDSLTKNKVTGDHNA